MEAKRKKKTSLFFSSAYQSIDFSFPIGDLRLTITGEEVFSIQPKNLFKEKKASFSEEDFYKRKKLLPSLLIEVTDQLKAYFEKRLKTFDLPLKKKRQWGRLDEKVHSTLKGLPFGSVLSYSDLAFEIGNPKACRAVGGSCKRNPFLIVVPCHRVINKNGSLGGFAIGLSSKKALLKHEDSLSLLNSIGS